MTLMREMRDAMNAKGYTSTVLRERVDELWPLAKENGWDNIAFQNSIERPDLADRMAAVMLSAMFELGQIALMRVFVDEPPTRDRDREANQDKLDDLPHPFVATVEQTNTPLGVADGVVRWTEPVTATAGDKVVTLLPGFVVLEIGFMSSAKTQGHVISGGHGGLARWPYRDNAVTIMVPRSRIDLWPREVPHVSAG